MNSLVCWCWLINICFTRVVKQKGTDNLLFSNNSCNNHCVNLKKPGDFVNANTRATKSVAGILTPKDTLETFLGKSFKESFNFRRLILQE